MKYINFFENFKNNNCKDFFDIDTITGSGKLSELEKPLYYFVSKRKKAKLVYMSPKEYLIKISKLFKLSYKDTINGPNVDYSKVDKYSKAMKSGDKFPVIWYDLEYSSQEGRHRALACLKLGCEEIPVIEFRNIGYEEFITFVNSNKDKTFEEMDILFKNMGYSGISRLGYNDFKRYIEYN